MGNTIKGSGRGIQRVLFQMLKLLVMTYLITGVLLLILAFLMYKFDLKEQQINIAILIIMIISTFIGGFMSAKVMKERRLIYGGIIGVVYFIVLLLISLGMHHGSYLTGDSASLFFICLGGGAIGGMFG